MLNFSIGLTGLEAAQHAIELVGANIANAATEGYHRQTPQLAPAYLGTAGVRAIGGVRVADVRREIDQLLEQEINHQRTLYGQVSQELTALEAVESAFGQLGSEGLTASLSQFFDSLTELASQPDSLALREQVVHAADTLANHFRIVRQVLTDMADRTRLQAEEYIARINNLASQAADLNRQITEVTVRGGKANLLCDERDQAIRELSDLMRIQTICPAERPEIVNVAAYGKLLVTGESAVELEVGLTADSQLGLASAGVGFYQVDPRGGRLGGAMALYNDLLPELADGVDRLAREILSGINRLHVQGVGTTGSFTELIGWPVAQAELSGWTLPVEAGSFHVRLIEESTGQITRYAVAVDPATDDVEDVADRLDDLAHLSAAVVDSTLRIAADPGWRFDFLPALLPDPTTSHITGDARATVSGLYDAEQDRTFTCTVCGTGRVGVAEDLLLEVRNEAGQLLATRNLGVGYAAGDRLGIGDGVWVALSDGQLNDGDEFTIEALAQSDPTGFLAAAGINTLFSGAGATDIAVRPEILSRPQLLAASVGAEMTDGTNVLRMAELAEGALPGLGGLSAPDHYRRLVTGLGGAVALRQAKAASFEDVLRQLGLQRDDVSGVDINEEATKLLVFERMFQAMSKLITTQDRALQALLDLL